MPSHKNKSNKYTLLVIILALGGFLFFSLIQFFTAFLGSVIFYVLTKNFMLRLTQRYHWNKSLSALVIMVITFFIILLPVSLMATMLYGKLATILSHPEQLVATAKQWDALVYNKIHYRIISPKTMEALPGIGTKILGSVVSTGVNTFTSVMMMYFFLYFMLINIGRMEAGLILFLPFDRVKMMTLGKELYAQTLSNSVAVPLIGLAQGLCGYISYRIAGVPEAGFWGVLTGFASIIPVVGATLIWAPITVYLFAQQQIWQGFVVLGICVLLLGTIDNVIRFMMAKKMADVHPVITVLGVIMGLNFFGISGLIFGPLLISYFFILIKMYYLDYMRDDETIPETEENIPPPPSQRWPTLAPFNFILKKKKETP